MSYDFISAKGIADENEISELSKKYSSCDSQIMYIYTTRFGCEKIKELDDIHHLLEIRIFDENSEFRAVRSQINKTFKWRFIDDNEFEAKLKKIDDEYDGTFEMRTYEECQYLDVNTKLTQGTDYVFTGGGHYKMPESNLEKVQLLNYVVYDSESGILKIADFRIVKLIEKGEK